MLREQTPKTIPDGISRCEEPEQPTDPLKPLSPAQKKDRDLENSVTQALWNDDVLRTLEYYQIDVSVRKQVVYLNGHIVSTTSQSHIDQALRGISSILEVKNNLVIDEELTLQVAESLGRLEHTYGCKFFTGAMHGLISLNGVVANHDVRSLAERCAADHPNVRGVINHLRISGINTLDLRIEPFLQPTIGEIIYFLDGLSGIVKQVVINPNNRRVIAMLVSGRFADQMQELRTLANNEARQPERLIILSMDLIRYLTRTSGFLQIKSNDRKLYMDFDSTSYKAPNANWVPPYPYCPQDVLFPAERHNEDMHQLVVNTPLQFSVPRILEEVLPGEKLIINDSLGG